MVRGEATQTKVHLKGKEDDFLIFVDDAELYKKWQGDKSVPMAHFVSSFKIFVTHRQGAQGTYDAASKATLENEFGTHNEDDVIKQILEKGETQVTEFPDRGGVKNESQGPRVAH
ncbi:SDO1-like protein [Colletotrichum sidae]|uniref:SDO1-like protein n=4 Tax=Colletotrichum orbiculare species complex TaxID=2707354 RepID=N4V3C2_COLOR|nr:SDO1-like protein [Colletotrichum orbiculare MAFF 240422]TDZ27178.1 SDO1-like protein [Colletotrichum spinosum]TDZ74333.1 SDO1-like protein [Colletotrichum trifolii]TEA16398.1 SDO1-like protein [Colletotrichum sidae]